MSDSIAPRRFSLLAALLAVVGLALLAGIIPAGAVLDRWVAQELKARARRDLEMAPALLTSRDSALHDAMMMHAKDMAHAPALAAAVGGSDRLRAVALAEPAARALSYAPVLVGPDGSVWEGPAAAADLVPATRRGEMPVEVIGDGKQLSLVSLAPVPGRAGWAGAVGVMTPLDDAAAGVLAALTRSDVVVLLGESGGWVANAGAGSVAGEIARAALAPATDSAGPPVVRELTLAGGSFLVATVPLGGATAVLARDLRRDLAIVPRLRWVLLFSGLIALGFALLLGAVLARGIARPVRALADAADRLSGGDFDAPLGASSVRELDRVTAAFGEMRRALANRIEELRSANRLLEERQARLATLQTELIQRERVATSARMVAELAHEIRNPVANVRNCLELLQRRVVGDPEAEEYAGLAIDELLRMHELAERMLDLNRPKDTAATSCDAALIARDVIALARLGDQAGVSLVVVDADGPAHAAIPPDALKQVLLNLVQNAREAVPRGLRLELWVREVAGRVHIRVADNGPGIPAELRDRIFDPFFTTRGPAGGVGLGLFLVEGVVRANGGTVALLDPPAGACFEITLPAVASTQVAAARARSA